MNGTACGANRPSARSAQSDDAECAGEPGEQHHAGDHRRRSEHDADLERRRRQFVVMVFRRRQIALCLRVLGLLLQLLAAIAGFRIRFVALGGLAPCLDLLVESGLGGRIGQACRKQSRLIGCDAYHGPADILGLEERPQVRSLDVLGHDLGLRAFAERFRERQEQRQNCDHQCDFPVEALAVLAFLGLFDRFADFRHVRPSRVLPRRGHLRMTVHYAGRRIQARGWAAR